MSFDLKYEAICDHRTHLETHTVERDRQTVLLPRPVTRQTFHVYLNGYELKSDHATLGWTLLQDPNGGTPDYLKLVFRRKLRSYDDIMQLTYQTTESNCRRCHGKRLYFDLDLDSAGRLKIVVDESKLVQDLRKGVLTVRGTNRYANWYGTALITFIGTKVSRPEVVAMRMQREVSQFVDSLMKMQIRQAQVQPSTLREMILQILGVEARALDEAGTIWEVTTRLSNRAGNETSFTQELDLYNAGLLPKTSSQVR